MKVDEFLVSCSDDLTFGEIDRKKAELLLRTAWYYFACLEFERGPDYAGKLLEAHPWPEELD